MKKILPLVAVSALAAACNMHDDDHYNNRTGEYTPQAYSVAPAGPAVVTPTRTTVVRPDGTYSYSDGAYVAQPVVAQERGYQPTHADDALSDRSLGATRGTHGQPMSHLDSDNDGNYDYQPEYRYSTRGPAYYYSY